MREEMKRRFVSPGESLRRLSSSEITPGEWEYKVSIGAWGNGTSNVIATERSEWYERARYRVRIEEDGEVQKTERLDR